MNTQAQDKRYFCAQCMCHAVEKRCPYDGIVPADHDIREADDTTVAFLNGEYEREGEALHALWLDKLPQHLRSMHFEWGMIPIGEQRAWKELAQHHQAEVLALANWEKYMRSESEKR